MSAADFNSNEIIKAGGIGQRVQRLKNNEKYGTKRILTFTTLTAAAGFGVNSIGDRLLVGFLPRYSRVTGCKISTGAMGTGATLSIGTDATTYAQTQPDYGAGTGTEITNALAVATASTTPLDGLNQISVADTGGQPQDTAIDEVRIASGLGFENVNGLVAIYLTSGGATFATGKLLYGVLEFVSQTV